MSWILNHKKLFVFAFAILCLAIFVCVFTGLWYVSLVMVMILPFLMANRYVVKKNYSVIKDLSATREIKKITTLVIGDVCSHRDLSSLIDESETLFFTCPYRSLSASYQILLHVSSRIDENGLVIIIDRNKATKNQHTIFDVNFYSQVTKKELGLNFSGKEMKYPFWKHPLISFLILIGYQSKKFKPQNCPNQSIVEFCIEKNIRLIYLTK